MTPEENQGYEAFLAGLPRQFNPFLSSGDINGASAWLAGWDTAQAWQEGMADTSGWENEGGLSNL